MIKWKKKYKHFNGETRFGSHYSKSTLTEMNFSCYMPNNEKVVNCLIYLSGLTCTEENVITKAGIQRFLSGTNTMLICPDTSPRNLNILGVNDDYDFGEGASFYVNATENEYAKNYKMEDYIVKDLIELCKKEFNIIKFSLFGHSMGGHGALTLGLKNKCIFTSLSAFSPIVNPILSPWGQKALRGYLGEDKERWLTSDATELIKNNYRSNHSILIDQGLGDEFLDEQLLTNNFIEACKEKGQRCNTRFHKNFDHSYYFISTFIKDHIDFHISCME